jgi:hypothetical protein
MAIEGRGRAGYLGLAAFLALAATMANLLAQPVLLPRPASPLDEPLRLMGKARGAYVLVNDYTCLLIKRERIAGKLTPEHTIAMQFKKQPFSVYMHWKGPRELAGQEVCYVEGRHGGKMRVKPRGLLSALGWLTVDTNDPRARRSSGHDIREAGIGNLMDRYARGWEAERRLDRTQVRISPYELNNRLGTRVELIHPNNAGGKLLHYRDVLFFDQQTNLLVRMECYDWPHRAGAAGELIEMFDYTNLRVNVGLRDSAFRK